MTDRDLDIIANAVCFAYGRLTRDGAYMSEANWKDMMHRLERAYKICHKAADKHVLHLADCDHPWRARP